MDRRFRNKHEDESGIARGFQRCVLRPKSIGHLTLPRSVTP